MKTFTIYRRVLDIPCINIGRVSDAECRICNTGSQLVIYTVYIYI